MNADCYSVAKKCVQMHMLARNSAKLVESAAPQTYCQHLQYSRAYLATKENDGVYFIEPYLEGVLVKYINNTGEMYPSPSVGVNVDPEVYS